MRVRTLLLAAVVSASAVAAGCAGAPEHAANTPSAPDAGTLPFLPLLVTGTGDGQQDAGATGTGEDGAAGASDDAGSANETPVASGAAAQATGDHATTPELPTARDRNP